MTDLSPAAQAVLGEYSAAADFTALAVRINVADAIRQDILAIAADRARRIP